MTLKKLIILFISLTLFLSTSSFAITMESDNGGFKVTYSDSVNVFEPIKLHFEVLDKELIKNTNFIFGQFEIPLTEGEGFKSQSDLSVKDPKHYNYNNQNSFDIVISLLNNGALDLNNKDDYIEDKDDLETLREIGFYNNKNEELDKIKILIKVNKYDFDIKNVPVEFSEKIKDLNTLSVGYSKKDSGMINHINMHLIRPLYYQDQNEPKLLNFDSMNQGMPLVYQWVYDGILKIPKVWTKETFIINDYPAILFTNCEINGDEKEDLFSSKCSFLSQIGTDIGVIEFDIRYSSSSNKESKVTAEAHIEEWKTNTKDIIKNIILDGGKTKKVQEEKETYIRGHIINIDGNPLPYMKVSLWSEGKEIAKNYTDLNGNYNFNIKNLNLKEDEKKVVSIVFYFNYFKNKKNYFKLFMLDEATGNYINPDVFHTMNIEAKTNYEYNLKLDGTVNREIGSVLRYFTKIRDYGVIYYRMHEAVEFSTEKLFQKLDKNLPLPVYIGNLEGSTLYSSNGYILIAKSDESYLNSNNPRNREYHEFAHHLMYSTYGSWTGHSNMSGTINHAGFMNPTSADSFDEGFAEFMALANAKYLGYSDAEIYAGFGSMEDNYKPWHGKGYDEEFAIASLLWDMIDSNNEPGDSLTMSIEDVWRVIGVKQDDMYGYYKAFIKRFPDKKKAIDDVFILHGFFADTNRGNNIKDIFEPSRTIGNTTTFVDLSCNKTPCIIKYNKNMTIGQATNFARPTRSKSVSIPGSYIKVDINGPRLYKITVDYEDISRKSYSYIVEMRSGLVYVNPRPDDVIATITIEPETKDFTYKKPYVISNTKLIENIYSNSKKKYFAEPDFKLIKLNTKLDPVYSKNNFEPNLTNDNGRLNKRDFKIIKGKYESDDNFNSNSSSSSSFSFIKILILILILGFIYLYIKKPKVKSTTNTFFNKLIRLFKKYILFFKKNILPIIIKWSKKIWKWILKIKKIILYHSKKTYTKIKFHIKNNKISKNKKEIK